MCLISVSIFFFLSHLDVGVFVTLLRNVNPVCHLMVPKSVNVDIFENYFYFSTPKPWDETFVWIQHQGARSSSSLKMLKKIEYQLTNSPVLRVKDLDKAVLEICFAESDAGWTGRVKLAFNSPHGSWSVTKTLLLFSTQACLQRPWYIWK